MSGSVVQLATPSGCRRSGPERESSCETVTASAGSHFAEVVERFAADLRASGYDYGSTRHEELVRTFVTSLATKRFVILTGLSGSGKTKIAQNFGNWLGPEQLKIIAVRPDWTNPDPLLGYENGLSELKANGYAWHVPEALEFALQAVRHPHQPYLLLLDEMNLAHVERYFADVLSGMESELRDPAEPRVERRGVAAREPSMLTRLPFPPNLLVVGTVNVDETTYMFSPKVLDRANTIEFRVATEDLQAHGGRRVADRAGTARARLSVPRHRQSTDRTTARSVSRSPNG